VAGERVCAAEAYRADDVGRVAAGDLGRERVVCLRIKNELALDLNVGVRGVEILDDLLFDLDLLRIVAGAKASIPAHDCRSGSDRLRRDDDRSWRRSPRRFGRCFLAGRSLAGRSFGRSCRAGRGRARLSRRGDGGGSGCRRSRRYVAWRCRGWTCGSRGSSGRRAGAGRHHDDDDRHRGQSEP